MVAVHVEVDQAPVLQECVKSDDGAHVAWKLFPTLSGREIGRRLLPVQFDNEVPVVEVLVRSFVREFSTEEFRQALRLELMNLVQFKPTATAWYDQRAARIVLQALSQGVALLFHLDRL